MNVNKMKRKIAEQEVQLLNDLVALRPYIGNKKTGSEPVPGAREEYFSILDRRNALRSEYLALGVKGWP